MKYYKLIDVDNNEFIVRLREDIVTSMFHGKTIDEIFDGVKCYTFILAGYCLSWHEMFPITSSDDDHPIFYEFPEAIKMVEYLGENDELDKQVYAPNKIFNPYYVSIPYSDWS